MGRLLSVEAIVGCTPMPNTHGSGRKLFTRTMRPSARVLEQALWTDIVDIGLVAHQPLSHRHLAPGAKPVW